MEGSSSLCLDKVELSLGEVDERSSGPLLSSRLTAFLQSHRLDDTGVGASLASLGVRTVADLAKADPAALSRESEPPLKLLQARKLVAEASAALIFSSKGFIVGSQARSGSCDRGGDAVAVAAAAGPGASLSAGDDDDGELSEARAAASAALGAAASARIKARAENSDEAVGAGAVAKAEAASLKAAAERLRGRHGELLLDRGRFGEAKEVLAAAVVGLGELFGDDHPDSLAVRGNLGLCLIELGAITDAGEALVICSMTANSCRSPMCLRWWCRCSCSLVCS